MHASPSSTTESCTRVHAISRDTGCSAHICPPTSVFQRQRPRPGLADCVHKALHPWLRDPAYPASCPRFGHGIVLCASLPIHACGALAQRRSGSQSMSLGRCSPGWGPHAAGGLLLRQLCRVHGRLGMQRPQSVLRASTSGHSEFQFRSKPHALGNSNQPQPKVSAAGCAE